MTRNRRFSITQSHEGVSITASKEAAGHSGIRSDEKPRKLSDPYPVVGRHFYLLQVTQAVIIAATEVAQMRSLGDGKKKIYCLLRKF